MQLILYLFWVFDFSVVAMQLDQGRNIASAVAEFIKGDTFEVAFMSIT